MRALGSIVPITGTFRNAASTLTDPTTITLIVRDPDDELTTYIYPDDLSRVSQGTYRLTALLLDKSGTWFYRWEGTGAVEAIDEGAIFVQRSYVLDEA
jgi:hypothetical protein